MKKRIARNILIRAIVTLMLSAALNGMHSTDAQAADFHTAAQVAEIVATEASVDATAATSATVEDSADAEAEDQEEAKAEIDEFVENLIHAMAEIVEDSEE